jgi:hypothetical protein
VTWQLCTGEHLQVVGKVANLSYKCHSLLATRLNSASKSQPEGIFSNSLGFRIGTKRGNSGIRACLLFCSLAAEMEQVLLWRGKYGKIAVFLA